MHIIAFVINSSVSSERLFESLFKSDGILDSTVFPFEYSAVIVCDYVLY